MSLAKLKKDKRIKQKPDKKLAKLINESDSGSESEHELSYYLNDRVKLMKEVIRILKPKKIKSMAPTCMKDLNNEEVSSMLLEELLGISNKRLKKIFEGQPQDDDTSSTEEEEEKSPDVISLDDISEDDFVIDLNSDESETQTTKKKKGKIKEEPKEKRTKVKKEKLEKRKTKYGDGIMNEASEEHLMSVLELLELQARARAIRSQLAVENSKKLQEKEKEQQKDKTADNSDIEDAIIIESPKNEEILISSSDSENEGSSSNRNEVNKISSPEKSIWHKTIDTIEDANTSLKETVGNPSTSSYKKTSRKSNADDVEIIDNFPEESRNSRLDFIPENPEEINKLLNKFHKMKRRKRKSFDQDSAKHEKRTLDRKSCRLKNMESNNSNLEGHHTVKEASKKLEDVTKYGELEVDKSVTESQYLNKDSQKNLFVEDHCSADGDESIILNLDQAEMDSINLDPENHCFLSETVQTEKKIVNSIKDLVNTSAEITEVTTDYNTKGIVINNSFLEKGDKVKLKVETNQEQIRKTDIDRKQNSEEGEDIILNVDQSELDSINLD